MTAAAVSAVTAAVVAVVIVTGTMTRFLNFDRHLSYDPYMQFSG